MGSSRRVMPFRFLVWRAGLAASGLALLAGLGACDAPSADAEPRPHAPVQATSAPAQPGDQARLVERLPPPPSSALDAIERAQRAGAPLDTYQAIAAAHGQTTRALADALADLLGPPPAGWLLAEIGASGFRENEIGAVWAPEGAEPWMKPRVELHVTLGRPRDALALWAPTPDLADYLPQGDKPAEIAGTPAVFTSLGDDHELRFRVAGAAVTLRGHGAPEEALAVLAEGLDQDGLARLIGPPRDAERALSVSDARAALQSGALGAAAVTLHALLAAARDPAGEALAVAPPPAPEGWTRSYAPADPAQVDPPVLAVTYLAPAEPQGDQGEVVMQLYLEDSRRMRDLVQAVRGEEGLDDPARTTIAGRPALVEIRDEATIVAVYVPDVAALIVEGRGAPDGAPISLAERADYAMLERLLATP